MTAESHDPLVELDAAARPPMANGEVLFDEPWQGRIFGMAISLHEQGAFVWPEFQQALIDSVAEWERENTNETDYPYYEIFAEALTALLAGKGIVTQQGLELRTTELAARAHGHDH